MTHCDTLTMLSWVSLRVDNFAFRASSVKAMMIAIGLNLEFSCGVADAMLRVSKIYTGLSGICGTYRLVITIDLMEINSKASHNCHLYMSCCASDTDRVWINKYRTGSTLCGQKREALN